LPNSLAQTIQTMLADSLGSFIATATLKKNCEMIGTNPEELSVEHLPELSQKVEKSVMFFKDEASAKELSEKIRSLR
jgi:hypothetical protein